MFTGSQAAQQAIGEGDRCLLLRSGGEGVDDGTGHIVRHRRGGIAAPQRAHHAAAVRAAVERHRSERSRRQFERWLTASPDALIVTREDGVVELSARFADRWPTLREAAPGRLVACFAVGGG